MMCFNFKVLFNFVIKNLFKRENGTYYIANINASHEKALEHKDYIRGEIIFNGVGK